MLARTRAQPKARARGQRGGRRAAAAAASAAAAALFPATPTAARCTYSQGGALALECADGTRGARLVRLGGTPRVHANGSYAADPTCHHAGAEAILRKACEGQSHCCLPVGTDHFERKDPCHGTIKTLAVVVHGCRPPADTQTRYRRWCSLQGQWLLCDEDIEFLAALELPEVAPASLVPNVAAMVNRRGARPPALCRPQRAQHDGLARPALPRPVERAESCARSSPTSSAAARTLTDLGDDYMEDWQRLSSMMLLDVFWKAAIGRKVLIFQPDSIMPPPPRRSMRSPGTSTSARRWRGRTADLRPQLAGGVGCGGLARDRAKSILMSNTPACVTPAAGSWRTSSSAPGGSTSKRCAAAGITVAKPDRHKAARFAIEYDLYMDVLRATTRACLAAAPPRTARAPSTTWGRCATAGAADPK